MSLLRRERRAHPRVDDNVIIFWRHIETNQIPNSHDYDDEVLFFFPDESKINLLKHESLQLLEKIKHLNPLLGEYLELQEHRFDILAKSIQVNEEIAAYPPQAVNISASGIAFLCDSHYPVNAILELKIILPTSMHSIIAYGKVVDVNKNEGGSGYTLGVHFVKLSEYDLDHLVRHVARRRALLKLVHDVDY